MKTARIAAKLIAMKYPTAVLSLPLPGGRAGVLLLLLAAPLAAAEANWPQFRGPAAGISADQGLPDTWSTTQNVAWKVKIPGRGWSSPVVWGDKVFVTSVIKKGAVETAKKGLYFGGDRPRPPKETHRWMVYAIDWKSGKTLWEMQAHQGPPGGSLHIKNTYASETPVTDGERLYVYFGNLGLFCYDLDGKELWSQKWASHRMRAGWGTAASPVLFKGRLYVVNDNEEHSYLVVLDAKTGKEIWRADRDEKSNWATPFIWENEKRTELVTAGSGKVRSYDLDGKLLWELRGMSSITIPTPFARHGLLYVASGYVLDPNRPLYAIRPGANGDITLKEGENSSEFVAWRLKTAAPYNPSFLVAGDLLYVLYDRGFLSCYDARIGKAHYERQRIAPGATAFTSSPWASNDKIYCLSEDGDTFVIAAAPTFKLLRTNRLDDMCMATPAGLRGSLLIRTESKLYRIEKGANPIPR